MAPILMTLVGAVREGARQRSAARLQAILATGLVITPGPSSTPHSLVEVMDRISTMLACLA